MKYKNNYVYIIHQKSTNKCYIGVRSTNLQPKKDLGIIYFSSSTDDRFMKEQKEQPDKFKYFVVENFETRNEAICLEIHLHKQFDVAKNKNFFNKAKQTSSGFDTTGLKFNRNIKRKRRHTPWNEKSDSVMNDFKEKMRIIRKNLIL